MRTSALEVFSRLVLSSLAATGSRHPRTRTDFPYSLFSTGKRSSLHTQISSSCGRFSLSLIYSSRFRQNYPYETTQIPQCDDTLQSVFAVNNCLLVLGSRGTHIRLLTISRLLDLCPAALSYSLKEKFMLIGFPVRSHVIFA